MKSERRKYEVALIFVVLFALLTFLSTGGASAATHYVNPGESIQAAVDNATAGDMIIIRAGTYTENVDVNKSLTIRSESGSASMIVQANNSNDNVFEITADHVNISGFMVEGATGSWTAGIYLYHADNCNISNNNCSDNNHGILLEWCSNNTISNNSCSDNSWYGIRLQYSNNNILKGNTMVNNGILIGGWRLSHYIQEIDESNTVNGKPVYYWKNITGGRVPEGAGQVILVNCSNVLVENQEIYKTSTGISIAFSYNITIKSNDCSDNLDGILLWWSNNNNISNNNLSHNWAGISLYESNNNILKGNIMVNNGIHIRGSLSDHIHEIDESNTVNGKPVYYWKNITGGRVPEGAGQVILVNCSNVLVENQEIYDASEGIYVAFSSNITVKNNNCSDSYNGILLSESNNNTISNNSCAGSSDFGIGLSHSNNNTISNNSCADSSDYGIYLSASNNNVIYLNNFINNRDYGIYIRASNNSVIYLNNFINNANNVYSSSSTNIWNSTEEITYTYKGKTCTNYPGNYWDDYTDIDTAGDGIWDNPYSIDSDKDYYPLVEPWENYFASTTFKGDLNGDGKVTATDAVIALQIAVGSSSYDEAADMSGDGRITSLDTLKILQAAAGGISL